MNHPTPSSTRPAPLLTAVIPVYRSANMLARLHQRLTAVLDGLNKPYEIILVEDCGGDDSWDVIQQLSQKDQRVRGFKLGKNFGQHNALLCGIRAAHGQIIITLDDDLQNPPEEIPALLNKLSEGHDVVYGTPVRQQHGVLRDMASTITKIALQSAMGAENASKTSAFRVFRTRLREAFETCSGPEVSIDVLLTWGTTRFSHIPVRQDERTDGVSGYTARKLLTHATNMMTGFSSVPLQIASWLGFMFGILGMAALGYVMVNYTFSGKAVPGFTFLASIISIFAGVQLFTLGIFGEYLARIHFRTMSRPAYLVSASTDRASGETE